MTCQCPIQGYCPVFRRRMLGRMWEICSGKCSVPDEVRFEYIALWAHQAGEQQATIMTMLADWFPSIRQARGAGDIVAKLLSFVGAKTGADCKCDERQAWLNQLFPLK